MDTQLFDGMTVFTEVVRKGSFTKAAESTGFSTSYISKEVGKLEARLNLRLLNRTTRTLRLTSEGQVYFDYCQQIVSDTQDLEAMLSGQHAKPKGNLRISCPTSFGLTHLKAIIAKYSEMYPEVNLEVDLSDRKVDLVAEGYDVSIRGGRQLDDSSLIAKKLLKSHSVTIAAPSYLKKYGTPQRPEDLSSHHALCYSLTKNDDQWDFETKAGDSVTVKVNKRFITNSSQLELELCKSGQGITRMPVFNLSDELKTGELIELFPELPKLPIYIYVVYVSRKHVSATVRSFVNFITQEIGE
ncbi:LysR family transcriptional regulator [Vibrio tapetis]|uniref:Putative Transcriptional regulator, LysR family n=1 Tax=Vibrio tapetis subsp. tapetis TaxID=1671868 RepID=A0A2N8ZMU5_9VIBR|nr:LysR family transcriptional regulator [Vibrio tapetis]SON53244.1 putative Transcriptional regulator, LysR family [Vibrio tapetis subsp. tapetis]